MKKSSVLLLPSFISVIALLFAGCGSSQSSLADELISQINEIIDIIEDIDSSEDYDDSKDDLRELRVKMDDIEDELEEIIENELTDEEKADYFRDDMPRLMDAHAEMVAVSVKAVKFGFKIPKIDPDIRKPD
jgi:hypothetical protein